MLCLNRKNRLIKLVEATSGTATSSLAHPREVFRTAIQYGATAIVCVHNHPSGDPAPSTPDVLVTRQLREHGGLVRGLAAIDGILEPELIALCRSKWYSAKQAALEIMSKRASEDRACLKRILFESANAPNELLESVLKLPKPVLAEVLDEIVGLRHSARPEDRLIFMKALPSLPIPEERKEAIAREGLADSHPPMRDAATQVLRVQPA